MNIQNRIKGIEARQHFLLKTLVSAIKEIEKELTSEAKESYKEHLAACAAIEEKEN